jgi:drug/metabolite transporter (DMT)-like permease
MLAGVAAGLSAGALWALVFVAPRLAHGFSPVDFTAGRFVAYGAISLLMLKFGPRHGWPSLRQSLAALGMSVLGFTGYYLLLVLAVRDAGTQMPVLIIGTIPIWIMLLGRPAGLRFAAIVPGLILTLAGLAMVSMVQSSGTAPAGVWTGPAPERGLAFACLSAACWTAFGLMNSAWLKKNPDISAATWASWLGMACGVGSIFLWLIAGSDTKVLLAQSGWARLAIVCVATGLGSAWLATWLWNIASRRLSAALCGQLIVSETVFALFYSFVADALWPTPLQTAACVVFVAGILASIAAHPRPLPVTT